MDVSLVEKWLEQGERIEKLYLNVLKKNKANKGLNDGTNYFRQLYYHFDQLNDDQIEEAVKILNGFQRGKASGSKGREVVKDFLSNCLILLSNSQNRLELKQYLDKNDKMPIDIGEERRRLEEERRERIRRQQEAERKRREEEQKRRQREQERKQREDEEKRKFEENRGGSERTKGKEESYTAERKNPWSGVFKNRCGFIPYLPLDNGL